MTAEARKQDAVSGLVMHSKIVALTIVMYPSTNVSCSHLRWAAVKRQPRL
ncbi:hypothetical protein [Acetobacter malorum]|nr:hypothetical protein [Acetobacter malorum]KFL87523.1 hypothetical protein AmDm5_2939 [Acetobacter malorum]